MKKQSCLNATVIPISLLVCQLFTNSSALGQGTGLVFLPESEYKKIPLASSAMMGTLPASKDLSSWFPVPGNQGTQGSCVAWAVCYGLKSYQEAVERKQKPLSRNQVFSPAYIYNQIYSMKIALIT